MNVSPPSRRVSVSPRVSSASVSSPASARIRYRPRRVSASSSIGAGPLGLVTGRGDLPGGLADLDHERPELGEDVLAVLAGRLPGAGSSARVSRCARPASVISNCRALVWRRWTGSGPRPRAGRASGRPSPGSDASGRRCAPRSSASAGSRCAAPRRAGAGAPARTSPRRARPRPAAPGAAAERARTAERSAAHAAQRDQLLELLGGRPAVPALAAGEHPRGRPLAMVV